MTVLRPVFKVVQERIPNRKITDTKIESKPIPLKNNSTIERKSELELAVSRIFNGAIALVFQAWTNPQLFRQWWVPKSTGMSLLSCEMDVRIGGNYRLVLSHDAFPKPMEFFGRYLEVAHDSRLVWTNEESGDAGAVTTVTFEDRGGDTFVVLSELHPSKDALEGAIACAEGMRQTFEQLDELLVTLQVTR